MVRIHPDPPVECHPGAVAQLGERLLCKQEVIGSIPFSSTRVGWAHLPRLFVIVEREWWPDGWPPLVVLGISRAICSRVCALKEPPGVETVRPNECETRAEFAKPIRFPSGLRVCKD